MALSPLMLCARLYLTYGNSYIKLVPLKPNVEKWVATLCMAHMNFYYCFQHVLFAKKCFFVYQSQP